MSDFNIYEMLEQFKRANGIGNLNAANSALAKIVSAIIEHLDPGKAFSAFKADMAEVESTLIDDAKEAFGISDTAYDILSAEPAEDDATPAAETDASEPATATEDAADDEKADEPADTASSDKDTAPARKTRVRKS